MTVARPSLDDVYLAHTGRAYRPETQEAYAVTALAQTRPASPAGTCRFFSRQPYFIGIYLVQPVIWLLLFGALFQSVVTIPGFETGAAPTSTTSCPAFSS